MGRVALVPGGTRGIGAAICKALKKAGYRVAAGYGGNDDAGQAFDQDTDSGLGGTSAITPPPSRASSMSRVEVGPVEVPWWRQCRRLARRHAPEDDHGGREQVIRTIDSLFTQTRR